MGGMGFWSKVRRKPEPPQRPKPEVPKRVSAVARARPPSNYKTAVDPRTGAVVTLRPTGEVIPYARHRRHVALEGLIAFIPDSAVTLASGDTGWRRIRGESYRSEDVKRAFDKTPLVPPTQQRYTIATLLPDPTNSVDPHAVKVIVGGFHVGFMPKGQTGPYRRVIAELAKQGRDATCRAWIYCSEDDATNIRVGLALAWPIRMTDQLVSLQLTWGKSIGLGG
jgi:hypothetical protein